MLSVGCTYQVDVKKCSSHYAVLDFWFNNDSGRSDWFIGKWKDVRSHWS